MEDRTSSWAPLPPRRSSPLSRSSVGSGDVLRGEQKEFEAIITAVIGGTLLTGGYGSVIGTLFGALTLGIVKQGIFFAGISSDWYQAFLGALLSARCSSTTGSRTRAAQVRH